jgi:hypothetical protein
MEIKIWKIIHLFKWKEEIIRSYREPICRRYGLD